MYSYLIDNEEYVASTKLLKKGKYKMKERYRNSRGQRIYVIDKYHYEGY